MSVFQAFRHRPSLRLLLLLLLLFAAVPAATQPKGSKDQTPSFEDTSQVVAVEVPVNVVDRDGNPVRGLTAADFEVYDNNDRQPVSSFEVIDLKTLDTTAIPEADAGGPRVDSLRSGARRHFLFLFDLSFSNPTSIVRARLAARDFVLTSLHPTDLAAVATYSIEYGPKLVVTFTPDRAQLARAIDTLGFRRNFDARRVDPLRFMIEPPTSAGSLIFGQSESSEIKAQQDQMVFEYLQSIAFAAERIERSIELSRLSAYSRALGDVAKSLNAVKGRKHVVFFSEGFDSRLFIGRETTDEESETDSANLMAGRSWMVDTDNRYGNTGLLGDINRMLDEFQRSDCVIQAVDIGGLRAANDQRARPNGEAGLFYMAHETGGELFKDANNLRQPLERVLERTSVTYLLTFERSDLKQDGAYHRLKVKAKLPSGARLSHRAGYYAPRPFKDLDPMEKNLLASDGIASAAPKRDIDLNVLAAPFRASEALSYVPVILEIGGKSLLEGHTDKKKMNVEIYSYVSDAEGQMRDFFNQRVALNLDENKGRQSMEEGGIKYYGHFELPPGSYQVRVLVRNAETGRTGVQTVKVDVPAYSQAEPVLLPPFFMEDRQKWLLVREQDAGGQAQSVVYPFTVDGEPYVPSARPVLDKTRPTRLCLVAYNLGKGDLAVKGEVMAADGTSFPAGRLSKVERKPTGIQGLDKLVATFDPSGLNAGHYVLQVKVTDPATGHKEASSLPFQVQH